MSVILSCDIILILIYLSYSININPIRLLKRNIKCITVAASVVSSSMRHVHQIIANIKNTFHILIPLLPIFYICLLLHLSFSSKVSDNFFCIMVSNNISYNTSYDWQEDKSHYDNFCHSCSPPF